jgi:hypothetical protein
MIFTVVRDALIVEGTARRRERNVLFFHVGREVQQVLGRIFRHPEARQVDLAVRRTHRRRIQIHLAIGSARHSLPRIGIPLCARPNGESEQDRHGLDASDHVIPLRKNYTTFRR